MGQTEPWATIPNFMGFCWDSSHQPIGFNHQTIWSRDFWLKQFRKWGHIHPLRHEMVHLFNHQPRGHGRISWVGWSHRAITDFICNYGDIMDSKWGWKSHPTLASLRNSQIWPNLKWDRQSTKVGSSWGDMGRFSMAWMELYRIISILIKSAMIPWNSLEAPLHPFLLIYLWKILHVCCSQLETSIYRYGGFRKWGLPPRSSI